MKDIDYQPFSKEWEKEMMKFNKAELINFIKRVLNNDSKVVVYKDGSYIFTKVSFEYEGDPEWLTTINLKEQ